MAAAVSSGRVEEPIDFSIAGILVRSIFDPAKTGHTTGELVRFASRTYARLRLKSGEIGQFPCEQLERVADADRREMVERIAARLKTEYDLKR